MDDKLYTKTSKKKLFILGCAGIPGKYGGFETFAENISLILAPEYDITVACSTRYYLPNERYMHWKGIRRIFFDNKPNGIHSLLYDFKSLNVAKKNAETILILGSGGGIFLPFLIGLRKKKVIVHIDGIEWKRRKWGLLAKWVLYISNKLSLHYANHILIDNEALKKFIPQNIFHKLTLVGYGGEHNAVPNHNEPIHNKPFALVIARAEPENNLRQILQAFSKIDHLDLIAISNWEHTRHGKKLMLEYKCADNIHLLGPIYNNNELLNRYRCQCKVYIHGHTAGGTNPSLVEAMYFGMPILAHNNIFNVCTTNKLAQYFTDTNDLIEKLNADNLNPDTQGKSKVLREFAIKNYSWEIAAKNLKAIL